ncbi:hypothetical protein EIP91_003670 [Steccherinum ochraceum]|uniref:C2H2-type domain-containing protein n=1 Tax=Steccherinum ochraceum TaxID=92696 RepID=A0A4R0RLP5_9APHY|nr:hypothetical protein EIP91_003670 [Steccherinum ochraceum]
MEQPQLQPPSATAPPHWTLVSHTAYTRLDDEGFPQQSLREGAHTKQTPEPAKDESQKKVVLKKKSAEPGSWPCKINGCNKVFAREADLKRHQRTTKSHSMPGFACPQCDATFTRTDALRRHQKSRHNGVIIEPQDANKNSQDTNGEASDSGSSSRSGTPSGSNDQESVNSSPQASKSQPADHSTGYSSYYRPHTMHTSRSLSFKFNIVGPLSSSHWHTYLCGTSTAALAARLRMARWYHPSSHHVPTAILPTIPILSTTFVFHASSRIPRTTRVHEYHYPYSLPPMSFAPPNGSMQPPLSAIPRGSSSGSLKGDDAAAGEDSETEHPNKRRKRSHDSSSAADDQAPAARRNMTSDQTTLGANLMLDDDEAATVVALLQQASGHAFSVMSSSTGSKRASGSDIKLQADADHAPVATVAPADTTVKPEMQDEQDPDAVADRSAEVDEDAEGEADVDADADGDADAEGEADLEADFVTIITSGQSEDATSNVQLQPQPPSSISDQLLTEDWVPMLNPGPYLCCHESSGVH